VLPALLPAFALVATASPAPSAPVPVNFADLPAIRAAVTAPGASAVLVTIWATWCDACRDEMPAVLRFFHTHQSKGLRLILVSADDEDQRVKVEFFLKALGAQGAQAFIKQGDNDAFVNGFDPSWTGAIPASFLYDGTGAKQQFWAGAVTQQELEAALRKLKKPAKGKP
jgi:thiol-disulfide isomerase/thioredoxin